MEQCVSSVRCGLAAAPRDIKGQGLLSRFLGGPSPPHATAGSGGCSAPLICPTPAGSAPGRTCFGALASTPWQLRAAPLRAVAEFAEAPVDLGFPRELEQHYTWGRELGKGGNGCVRMVSKRDTGIEYACKAIPKVLSAAGASETKRASHLASLRQEINVLTRLKGSLNVVKLEDVYEDEGNVYIVMEACKGGELWHAVGQRHYSERTVASYMRAVLRTLAQCHAHNILHRDVKPGNFMLLNDDPRSPLKAIDFGLAVSFRDGQPRTDLGLEGTPWYMAPETLRSEWLPASDLWAAGVMAYQLLSGRFPFDDKRNPGSPSISAIWRSTLCDDVSFKGGGWLGISAEARDFVRMLLDKDPAQRPSARDALKHPWLQGNSAERSTGTRISAAVIQAIQRYATSSVFQRTVLQAIAAELLAAQSCHGGAHPTTDAARPTAYCAALPTTVAPGGAAGQLGGQPPAGQDGCEQGSAAQAAAAAAPPVADVQALCQRLCMGQDASLHRDTVQQALQDMGFKLQASEFARLMEQVDLDGSGRLDRTAFVASQVDWRTMQRSHKDQWMAMARRVFDTMDQDGNGTLGMDDIMNHLAQQLPADEVSAAVAAALADAQTDASRGIDFAAFLDLLTVGSMDSLDIYDDALSRGSCQSLERLNNMLQQSLEASRHGAALCSQAAVASRAASSGVMATCRAPGHAGTLVRAECQGDTACLQDLSNHGLQDAGLAAAWRQGGASAASASVGLGPAAQDPWQHGGSSVHGVSFYWEPEQEAACAAGGLSRARPVAAPGAPGAAAVLAAAGDSGAAGVAPGGAGAHPQAPRAAAAEDALRVPPAGWNFDVGPKPSPPPAKQAAMEWRFEVAPRCAAVKVSDAGPGSALATGRPLRRQENIPAGDAFGGVRGGGSGSSRRQADQAAAGGVAGFGLGRLGGYCDRQMHGSNLYKNAVLSPAPLSPGHGSWQD